MAEDSALNRLMEYAGVGSFAHGGGQAASRSDVQPAMTGLGSFSQPEQRTSSIAQNPSVALGGLNPGVASSTPRPPVAQSDRSMNQFAQQSRLSGYRKRLFGDDESWAARAFPQAGVQQDQIASAPVANSTYREPGRATEFTQPYERQNPLQPASTGNNLASIFAQMRSQWGR